MIQAEKQREHVKSLVKRIRALEGTLARRKVEEALRYYTPNPKQELFHKAIADGRQRIFSFLGGNQSGKTTGGISEDVAHALGFRPWLPETHPNYKINIPIPNAGLIVGQSFGEQVKKILVPKLTGDKDRDEPGLIPKKYLAETKKNQQGIITWMKLTNGSTINLKSYEQDSSLYEGERHHWIHYDEPPPRAIWVGSQRGLIWCNGPCWVTMTPLSEAWFFDEVLGRDDVWKITVDITDNIGFGLTEEGVRNFELTLNEDEKEMRLHGRYFHLTGLVYKEYRSDIHRINRFKIDGTYGVWMHIDPHPRKPHHAIWLAAHPDGRLFVIGELVNDHSSNLTSHMAQRILAYEKEFLQINPADVIRLIDPLSKTNDPKDGGTTWKDFAECGVTCRVAKKDREGGISRVKRLLAYNPDQGQFPNLFFFRDLPRTHYEMTHYMWKEHSANSAESKDPSEEPKKKDDDLVEGLYRIILDNPEAPALTEYEREEQGPIYSTGMSVGY